MNLHPYIVSKLAEDRLLFCPCGAAAEHRGGFCRKCLAEMAWRHRSQSSHHAARRKRGRLSHQRARVLALSIARFRITVKEARQS